MTKMTKFNINEPIPDEIKCKKCGTINNIPNRFVFRFDPDGGYTGIFDGIANIPKPEETNDSPVSLTMYCEKCVIPLYIVEAKMSDLKDIDEQIDWETEWKEVLGGKNYKYNFYLN